MYNEIATMKYFEYYLNSNRHVNNCVDKNSKMLDVKNCIKTVTFWY